MTTKVKWVLDADIRKFYDTLDHGWSEKFVEYGIADRSVVSLIQTWLKAGVLLLKHYRDGVADVDHLDLQAHDFETSQKEVSVTLQVPDSKPAVSPEEARRRA